VVCDGSYPIGQEIVRADCGIHSFHASCEAEEGIRPKCQYPTDVFPRGNEDYLERNRPEQMRITGYGYHRNETHKEVLVTFHPEKREMYWYELRTLRHMFDRRWVELKMLEFFISEVQELIDP
jgi:hypothetical protein